jgi:hypothetical protein
MNQLLLTRIVTAALCVWVIGCKSREERAENYIRTHQCVLYVHVESTVRYLDNNGQPKPLDPGFSVFDCGNVRIFVDDVNGKPWKP